MASIAALGADPNVGIVLRGRRCRAKPTAASTIACQRPRGDPAKNRSRSSPVSHSQTDYSRALRAGRTCRLQRPTRRCAPSHTVRRDACERLHARRRAARTAANAPGQAACAGRGRGAALDEVESKAALRAYGIATPAEALVASPAEAATAAARIGYPVVLKAVSATLTHKSDVGAVALNLTSADELIAAYAAMSQRLQQHALSGMLVCQQVRGGLELVLGLHRDPEMGLVVMAGSGGVLLELVKDVAFCVPPVTRDKAHDLIGRTRAARLLQGYRGAGPRDIDAIAGALMALGRLAEDGADVIESIDINPFVALPQGQGGLALDALIVLRRR
jgi:hypothetical protein